MTEDDLLNTVIDMCRHLRVLVHHCRPARMADGSWRTPIQGHAGFVDLVMVGRRGVLYRELKSERGRGSAEQAVWWNRLTAAGQDVATWRPSDLASGRIASEIGAIR